MTKITLLESGILGPSRLQCKHWQLCCIVLLFNSCAYFRLEARTFFWIPISTPHLQRWGEAYNDNCHFLFTSGESTDEKITKKKISIAPKECFENPRRVLFIDMGCILPLADARAEMKIDFQKTASVNFKGNLADVLGLYTLMLLSWIRLYVARDLL